MSFFVRVSTSENSFNPPLPLKGKWEAALVDLNLNDVPPAPIKHHDVGVRKYKRKDFEPMINLGERGIMMNFYAQVEMDRMIIRDSNSEEDARMRRAFQKYNYEMLVNTVDRQVISTDGITKYLWIIFLI